MAFIRSAAHLPPRSTRARIGLFGGSFDPPHAGHLHVAETAMKRLGLDQVWWFPTPGNPLKEAPSDYQTRFDAVCELTRNHRHFHVSDVEKRRGLRYTIDLVRMLTDHCPYAGLVWIVGGDSLTNFHRWKDWRTLTDMIPVAVIARPGYEIAARSSPFAKRLSRHRLASHAALALPQCPAPAWIYLPAPLNPISSTALRKARHD